MRISAIWLGLGLVIAASATPVPVQITGITGGFTVGCAGDGCGGKFDATVGGASMYVYCIDAQNSVFIPSLTYDANVTAVTAGADLSDTRYGRAFSQWDGPEDPILPVQFRNTVFQIGSGDALAPTPLERYQMEAWLVSQYSVAPVSERTLVQDAIWQVTDVIPPADQLAEGDYIQPPYPGGAKGQTVGNLLSGAAAFVKYNDSAAFLSKFEIITNAGPLYLEGQNPAQELIAFVPSSQITSTPEPVTFAGAIAAILLPLAILRARRSGQRRAAALL